MTFRLDLIPDEVREYPGRVIANAANSLLLLGPSGAGKTTCAKWCVARLLSLDYGRFHKVDKDRQWYLGWEIAQRITDHAVDQLDKIKRRPLLVVDAWTESLEIGMDGLLDFRVANQLPTIVTCHLEVESTPSGVVVIRLTGKALNGKG